MAASEVASCETNFFSIAGISEAKTSVSGKAEVLLAIGRDRISKLFGVTFTYKLQKYIFYFKIILSPQCLCTESLPAFQDLRHVSYGLNR